MRRTLATSQNFDIAADSALLTLNEAAAVAAISRATLYRLEQSGKIAFVKIGRSTRIRAIDLRRLIGAAP